MTIRFEHDAVLCVLRGSPIGRPPLRRRTRMDPLKPPSKDGDAVVVPISSCNDDFFDPVQSIRKPTCSFDVYDSCPDLVEIDSDDDDCLSVSSCSTDVSVETEPPTRLRVTFAQPLVSEVRTRPRTLTKDLHALFYTYEETQRFRQEYRSERKMLSMLDEDPADSPATEEESSTSSSSSKGSRHRISRVVVMHNDHLETFYNDDITPKPLVSLQENSCSCDPHGNFFDNDNFWSGSITWY